MVKNIFKRNNEPEPSAKKIAFVHHKGGTGKTTSCLNIAGWLAKMEKKVLVVDLDPQGNATTGLGIDRRTCEGSIYDVFFGQKNIEEVILETDAGVFLIPSSIDLMAVEMRMARQLNNTSVLKESLESIEGYLDYILIDVPPGSILLMANAIVASENIIIPLDSGVFAYETLDVLKTLVTELREELGVETNVMMVLLREYSTSLLDKRTTNGVKRLLKKFLAENGIGDVKLFTIPFSRKVYWSQMKGMPISHYAAPSNVGRAYKQLAEEVLCYQYQ
jgi:chromosome partitioning protein